MMPIDMDTGENQVPGEWKVLSSGCAAGIVLTIDFEAVGRPEACFSDLAAMLGPSREVWAATELPSGTDAAARASAYLQHWTRDLRDGGREVSAVLGFCAGGVFAAALADEIAQWQAEPPAAILLDPEVPTSATLVKQLENATRGLEQAGSETGLAKARETAARLGSTEDLPSLGRKLTFLYHELSEPVFAQIGLDAEEPGRPGAVVRITDVLSGRSRRVAPGKAWETATAVVSATPIWEPTGMASQIRVDADHAGLLRSRAVARLISEMLD